MGFSRQEYWSGLLCPPPGHLLDPGIKLSSLTSPVLAGEFFTTSTTWEAHGSGGVDFSLYFIKKEIKPSGLCFLSKNIGQ